MIQLIMFKYFTNCIFFKKKVKYEILINLVTWKFNNNTLAAGF